jgi:hypothetical protein
MPLEDVLAIDIGLKTADGGVELVVTDSGVTVEPTQRLALLREKLRTYAQYIKSQALENDFPTIDRNRVRIRVVCANPPSEEMATINAVSIKSEQPVIVPVIYQQEPI